jgi:hypothetical protein
LDNPYQPPLDSSGSPPTRYLAGTLLALLGGVMYVLMQLAILIGVTSFWQDIVSPFARITTVLGSTLCTLVVIFFLTRKLSSIRPTLLGVSCATAYFFYFFLVRPDQHVILLLAAVLADSISLTNLVVATGAPLLTGFLVSLLRDRRKST